MSGTILRRRDRTARPPRVEHYSSAVNTKRTMKAFDEMCLTPVEDMPPEKIRALRLRENASQAVFARHLNVTAGLVSQWERGEKRPAAPPSSF